MRWMLLDPNFEKDDFILSEIRLALQRSGESVNVIRLTKSAEEAVQPGELESRLKLEQPDIILWCNVKGLPYFNLWNKPEWQDIPKVILWFDEPQSAVERYGLESMMCDSRKGGRYYHFIWDGYWRQKAKELWGIHSHPIHLACNPRPMNLAEAKGNVLGSDERLHFIGMIHSQHHIETTVAALSLQHRKMYRLAVEWLENMKKDPKCDGGKAAIPSWDQLVERMLPQLQEKERQAFHWEAGQSKEMEGEFRWALWATSKNWIRIRMLQWAVEVAPVALYCETRQMKHACREEYLKIFSGKENQIRWVDTSDWRMDDVIELHGLEGIQLQAIDPQSVEGGIPYRVFQTAHLGGCLLTDIKPELADCFDVHHELAVYDSKESFQSTLEMLLKDPERRKLMGQRARQHFESEHTWSHRIHQIQSTCFSKTPTE